MHTRAGTGRRVISGAALQLRGEDGLYLATAHSFVVNIAAKHVENVTANI